MKKNSLFDTIVERLVAISHQNTVRVDTLALGRIRDIEELLSNSELSQAEINRAEAALHAAYSKVDPLYNPAKARVVFKVLGKELSYEAKKALAKKPSVPKGAYRVGTAPLPTIGDSDADKHFRGVMEKIRLKIAPVVSEESHGETETAQVIA